MWIAINDCGKQITDHSRLRERPDQQEKLYEVIEVEFDQYKLQLVSINGLPAEKVELVLNCKQLLQYHFEVESNQ